MEQLPERHIECSECKKPVAVCYTEIVGKTIYRVVMCNECPLFQQKLSGHPQVSEEDAQSAGLCCGMCGMRADEVKMGGSLGCSLCYEVFEDLLIRELVIAGRIPPKLLGAKKSTPLHIGRTTTQLSGENISTKLVALHQALNETLSREDYEQAAWLRDQIKALTERSQENDKGQS